MRQSLGFLMLLLAITMLCSYAYRFSARFPAWRRSTALQAVTDVGSKEEFDAALAAAGDNIVVIDYSTTWCGPCKFVLPKFEELSEKYENVVFFKEPRILSRTPIVQSRT